jgi:hypothetical protein
MAPMAALKRVPCPPGSSSRMPAGHKLQGRRRLQEKAVSWKQLDGDVRTVAWPGQHSRSCCSAWQHYSITAVLLSWRARAPCSIMSAWIISCSSTIFKSRLGRSCRRAGGQAGAWAGRQEGQQQDQRQRQQIYNCRAVVGTRHQ